MNKISQINFSPEINPQRINYLELRDKLYNRLILTQKDIDKLKFLSIKQSFITQFEIWDHQQSHKT